VEIDRGREPMEKRILEVGDGDRTMEVDRKCDVPKEGRRTDKEINWKEREKI
jgi:hypothetical protein